jgi:hypothetical protein
MHATIQSLPQFWRVECILNIVILGCDAAKVSTGVGVLRFHFYLVVLSLYM